MGAEAPTPELEFTVVLKCLVRAGFGVDTAEVGFLEPGTLLRGVELREDAAERQRVRFDAGWVTVRHGAKVFAQPVAHTLDRSSREAFGAGLGEVAAVSMSTRILE